MSPFICLTGFAAFYGQHDFYFISTCAAMAVFVSFQFILCRIIQIKTANVWSSERPRKHHLNMYRYHFYYILTSIKKKILLLLFFIVVVVFSILLFSRTARMEKRVILLPLYVELGNWFDITIVHVYNQSNLKCVFFLSYSSNEIVQTIYFYLYFNLYLILLISMWRHFRERRWLPSFLVLSDCFSNLGNFGVIRLKIWRSC